MRVLTVILLVVVLPLTLIAVVYLIAKMTAAQAAAANQAGMWGFFGNLAKGIGSVAGGIAKASGSWGGIEKAVAGETDSSDPGYDASAGTDDTNTTGEEWTGSSIAPGMTDSSDTGSDGGSSWQLTD